jgi:GNAT superfamily N-acetyltransferase
MKLVERQYGRLNYDKTLYDEGKLYEGIKTEKYRFWLACCDNKDAGLVCLKQHPHFTGTFEGCTLTVLPEFRRRGIAKMLMDTMRETFGDTEGSSVFYSVLTTSLIEQNREYDNGFVPTGLALDRFLFDKAAANLAAESLPKRRHHIFMVLPLKKKETAKLFIPLAVEGFVRNIYDKLNVRIGERETKPAPSAVLCYPENRYIEIYNSLPEEIPEDFAANLFLDMTDSRTPERFAKLADRDWQFTGIKPLQETAEYIIMHRSGIDTALDETKTLPAFEAQKEEIRRLSNA